MKSEVVGKHKDSKRSVIIQDLISPTLESPVYQSNTVSIYSQLYLTYSPAYSSDFFFKWIATYILNNAQ